MNMHKPVDNILASRAMIAHLHIRQWSGRCLDREVTAEVNKDHGAKSDASRLNKLLVPADAMKEIVKIAGQASTEFRTRTLPWMTNGGRLLPAEKYMETKEFMRGKADEFDAAVHAFIAKYPTYQQQGRNALGTMYKPEDYPTAGELAGKFGLKMTIQPVPSGKDFRIDLARDEMERVRADVERDVREATEAAIGDLFNRVADVTGAMVERLTAYNGKGNRVGVFKDSLVGNVRDLVAILPSMNLTNDPRIDDLAHRLDALARTEPKELRDNKNARDSTRDEAERILKMVGEWM